MARKERDIKVARIGLLALSLIALAPSLLAENRLSFVVRSPEIVDVYLTNSDQVAAMQLFIHLDGPGSIKSADLIDRTGAPDWQLHSNILGGRDIRMLIISASTTTMSSGSGSVVRLHLERGLNSATDSTTLFFQTAILAGISAQALDVNAASVTFGGTQSSETIVRLDNYPNPFNPSTRISFELKRPAMVDLSVYDIQGRKIIVLINEQMNAGRYAEDWNGTDGQGRLLSSGLYVCRLLVDGIPVSRKMMLAK